MPDILKIEVSGTATVPKIEPTPEASGQEMSSHILNSLGMTLAVLALRLSNKSILLSWINGKKAPSPPSLARIAVVYTIVTTIEKGSAGWGERKAARKFFETQSPYFDGQKPVNVLANSELSEAITLFDDAVGKVFADRSLDASSLQM